MAKAKTQETSLSGSQATAPAPAKKPAAPTFSAWRMDRVNGRLEKLKQVRECVKISEEEAEVLNAGAEGSPSANPVMYFKNETKGGQNAE